MNLKKIQEHMADHHKVLTSDSLRLTETQEHSAIAFCECVVARDYRSLKAFIKTQEPRMRDARGIESKVTRVNRCTLCEATWQSDPTQDAPTECPSCDCIRDGNFEFEGDDEDHA